MFIDILSKVMIDINFKFYKFKADVITVVWSKKIMTGWNPQIWWTCWISQILDRNNQNVQVQASRFLLCVYVSGIV